VAVVIALQLFNKLNGLSHFIFLYVQIVGDYWNSFDISHHLKIIATYYQIEAFFHTFINQFYSLRSF